MKLKILIINWQDITNPLSGGAEVHLHEIFKRIAQQRHEVTLLCCHYAGAASEETVEGIRIIRRGHRNLFNYVVPSNYNRLNKKIDFDIIIDDINKIPFFTPLFVKKPLLGIIHHLFGSSIYIEAPLPFALYVNLAEKLIPRTYKNRPITVVSESTKTELLQQGFKDDNLHIIHNGVDLGIFNGKQRTLPTTPVIGYFGRIKKYKSVDHVLKAFKIVREKHPAAQLVIMGDGDDLPRLKKIANNSGINESINFTGALKNEEKLTNLGNVWFTVNPSPKEGWGLTVIESNACGVPVIAADSPGLRDSVVDRKTGLLYEYGNISQLSQYMIHLIEDSEFRHTLSRNSRAWAEKFSWNRSAEKMLQLIEKIIN